MRKVGRIIIYHQKSLSAVKPYSLSGRAGKSTHFKGLALPRAEHSAPLERKYLALLWRNSCCFLFTTALVALGTGEADLTSSCCRSCAEVFRMGRRNQGTHTYGSTCGTAQISEQHKYYIHLAHQSKVWASIYWWGGGAKTHLRLHLLSALRLFCSTLSQGTAIEEPEDCG